MEKCATVLPVRIASLTPAVTEILCALGFSGQIVCTDEYSTVPGVTEDLPHLKGHQNVSVAELMQYNPEIVFTSTVIQEELAARLKAAGMACVHYDLRTIDTLYESMRHIGSLLDCDATAEELVLRLQQGLNSVKEKSKLLPSRPRLYVEEWPAVPGIRTDGDGLPMVSGNWVPEVVRIAGCEPFPVPVGELSRSVTLEEVAAFDPDVIVISWCGVGAAADPALLIEREGWSVLRAVRSGHVRVIDDSLLNCPSPRLVEGAQRLYGWAFELLH